MSNWTYEELIADQSRLNKELIALRRTIEEVISASEDHIRRAIMVDPSLVILKDAVLKYRREERVVKG